MTALSPAAPAPVGGLNSGGLNPGGLNPGGRPLDTRHVDTRYVDTRYVDTRYVELAEFARTEYPRVVSTVRMVAGDRDDAVDAVQEAIMQLLAGTGREWPRNVAAWVTVVASNRARDAHRRDAARRRVLDRLRPDLPEDPVERVGRELDVLAALDGLPPRMREVCVLHYLLDRPVREIASDLGIGTGTVKTQLHRGRLALARRLRE